MSALRLLTLPCVVFFFFSRVWTCSWSLPAPQSLWTASYWLRLSSTFTKLLKTAGERLYTPKYTPLSLSLISFLFLSRLSSFSNLSHISPIFLMSRLLYLSVFTLSSFSYLSRLSQLSISHISPIFLISSLLHISPIFLISHLFLISHISLMSLPSLSSLVSLSSHPSF